MRLGKYLSSLTKPELEELTANCGFTDNELVIVKMLRNEKTSVEIANIEINIVMLSPVCGIVVLFTFLSVSVFAVLFPLFVFVQGVVLLLF